MRYLISKGMTRQKVGRALGITSNVGITNFFRNILKEENPNKNGSKQAEREKRMRLAEKIIEENNHLKTSELAEMVKEQTGYTKGTSVRKVYDYRKGLRLWVMTWQKNTESNSLLVHTENISEVILTVNYRIIGGISIMEYLEGGNYDCVGVVWQW